ncbi:ChaB family protein [Hoyosella sp. G463]|uniref:ChaB family protein n=1 Tax=Lolliginicoccus lacisalsi TaxID=2742202 RepID=A0A927PM57_9ACTN|nr:ChaB family protein [Lolliginicoccus lacisalsi]MBD8506464.1 ChaB family protein [Lolliginicoccus lacisalsi]
MPKTTRSGSARKSELPSTLKRSSAKAQRTFAKAYDSAMDEYGSEERAHRVAYDALKRTFQKVGDRWEAKEARGPSDERARDSSDPDAPTRGGVDAYATKDELLRIARRLDVRGRSTMRKAELVKAIEKANDRETRAAREGTSSRHD